MTLDGKFDDNVVVQIKHGPIDFQVREPASPLFGALENTNEAIELQITQEYIGPVAAPRVPGADVERGARFRPARDGRRVAGEDDRVGRTFHRPTGGSSASRTSASTTTGRAITCRRRISMASARLAWNPDLTARQIAEEWTRLTFGNDPDVVQTVTAMQLSSWRTYENYTGPLGLQTLTDIVGNHYGVAVEASERNGWGQWHRADDKGVGMDRTVATGTGYIGQYRPRLQQACTNRWRRCPDDLLLFMHHVPYTHVLHVGQDRHPAHLRLALRWRRCGRRLRPRVDDAQGPDR